MNPLREIRDEFRAAWREPSSRDMTVLALTFFVLLGLVGGYYVFWKSSWYGYLWFGVAIVLALCRLIPSLFRRIFRVWIGIAITLGYIVSRVLLIALFYLAVLPIGLIMRLLGKDPMRRKRDPAASSYWMKRDYDMNTPLERYERQF